MCRQLPQQWEQLVLRVERPVFNPPNRSGHCTNSIQSGDEQSISLSPGSRYTWWFLCEPKPTLWDLTLSAAFQTCAAGEACVLWEGPELHHPPHTAAVLDEQPRPKSIHTHWLCMLDLLELSLCVCVQTKQSVKLMNFVPSFLAGANASSQGAWNVSWNKGRSRVGYFPEVPMSGEQQERH